MRPSIARYLQPAAAVTKKGAVAKAAHILAPIKGLNFSTEKTTGDPLTAPILTNLVIDDDRVTARAGYKKISTHISGQPIYHLIPYYGPVQQMVSAVNHTLSKVTDGTVAKSGFTSDDWHWTAFANIGQEKFTVLVNGHDGVWSWNGGFAADGAVVNVTDVSKAANAVCTVSASDIGKFATGMSVKFSGATGGFAVLNGNHIIDNVNSPINTFRVPTIDTSAATGTATGVTAQPLGSFVKETVTPPTGETWVNTDTFNIVVAHQNRLFFADSSNLVLFYLPLQQKTGQVKMLPMNNMFRRGGVIRAMYTWSVDGGDGMDDKLVVFSSNGECIIWTGIDPDTDFQRVGIFRFDAPITKHCITNYGGDLYCLISTGMVPMTTVIRAETENLGQGDRAVISYFLKQSVLNRDKYGWMLFLNPSSSRMFCNIPQGGGKYDQMVHHMPKKVWMKFEDIPARTFGWIEPYVYFGDDTGSVYQMHPQFQNDDGDFIRIDIQTAWSTYGTPQLKHWKMVYPYIISDGHPRPKIDIRVDYDTSKPINQPDISVKETVGAIWNVDSWNTAPWGSTVISKANWNGVSSPPRKVGAIRLTASIRDCTFSIAGFDLTYETGGIL